MTRWWRRYEPPETLVAEHLTQQHPDWIIIWGRHSRRYWAFPLFLPRFGVHISAADPATLHELIVHFESLYRPGGQS